MNVDRLHHGAPAADHRALRSHDRVAVGYHRDIGRGAAHIGHHEVPDTAEETRTDDAGSRPGQHRLDRILEGHGRPYQRAVAAHDHERSLDAFARQHFLHRVDQVAHLRREPRVEGGGQGAARRIELRTQFVTAGDRFAAACADPLAHAQLMCRIAHREHGRDCERLHLAAEFGHCGLHRGLIERLGLIARGIVPAAHAHQTAGITALEPGALDHAFIEADQQRADGAEAPLHDRIGREGRRHRDQPDVLTSHAG
jgi:hypothetical protein